MNVLRNIIANIKHSKKNILLHEHHDLRVIKAVSAIVTDDIANISLLGNKKEILNSINRVDPKLLYIYDYVNIIDPQTMDKYVLNEFLNEKVHTGNRSLDLGHVLLKNNIVDGMVSGSTISTGDVLRSALKNVGLKDNIKTLSSYFLMEHKENKKPLLFADCAVNICPTSKQLSDITLSTVESYKLLFEKEPKVALLSHSTKGSSKGIEVEKVKEALEIIKDKNKNLCIDGELQLDAALIPEIAQSKAPNSIIEGDADILIFPNLDAGNIGYKILEKLGNYTATGPVLQGLNKPSNDLSRGCSANDIYNMIAITSL